MVGDIQGLIVPGVDLGRTVIPSATTLLLKGFP